MNFLSKLHSPLIPSFASSHTIPSLSFLVSVSEDLQHWITLLLHSSLCIVHTLAIPPSRLWVMSSNSPSDMPNFSNSALKDKIVYFSAVKFHFCYRM